MTSPPLQDAPLAAAPSAPPTRARVEIVVPVYNEAATLAGSIRRLHDHLGAALPFDWQITIADNASTDATPMIAAALADDLDRVRLLRLEEKGRGRALRAAWSHADADVLAYMDVDLSTDLRALLPLLAPLVSGHSDLAIGTRLAPSANVVRGPKRELISRAYNRLLHVTLAARFSDAQCGFKAIRADAAETLLPTVKDDGWFFDTELLVNAQREGLRIHEVPVDWVDDPDSRVDIVSTAMGDLRGIARLLWQTKLLRFALVGLLSTLAYVVLFLALRGPVGPAWANGLALALTAVGNTQANRHFTFGIRGREDLVRHHTGGFVVFVLTLALTSIALAAMHGIDPNPPRALEVTVLIAASVAATVSRFIALRTWVFAKRGRVRAAARRAAVNALGRAEA